MKHNYFSLSNIVKLHFQAEMNNNAPDILHCDQCFKSSLDFPNRSNFFRHVRSHKKEGKCSKVFANKNNLVNLELLGVEAKAYFGQT